MLRRWSGLRDGLSAASLHSFAGQETVYCGGETFDLRAGMCAVAAAVQPFGYWLWSEARKGQGKLSRLLLRDSFAHITAHPHSRMRSTPTEAAAAGLKVLEASIHAHTFPAAVTCDRNDRARDLFGMAGVWKLWKNLKTDQGEKTFAVLTGKPNELITPQALLPLDGLYLPMHAAPISFGPCIDSNGLEA